MQPQMGDASSFLLTDKSKRRVCIGGYYELYVRLNSRDHSCMRRGE
jgi:hypothetical protein